MHVLNALAAKNARMYISRSCMFFGCGVKGIWDGMGGGERRLRQPQIALGALTLDDVVVEDAASWQADGKESGRMQRSLSAFSDSRHPLVF